MSKVLEVTKSAFVVQYAGLASICCGQTHIVVPSAGFLSISRA